MFRLFAVITFAACAALNFGCSAEHNLGGVATRPGVTLEGPSIFHGPRAQISGDCNASLEELTWGDLKIKGAEFGQRVTDVAALDPAIAEAIGAAQSSIARARGEAIANGIHASADVIDSIIPIFQWLQLGKLTPHESGMQLTLPNGLSIGGKSITGNAELQTMLAQLLLQAQQAKSAVSTAQAANAPAVPASQPAAGGQ